ncbi:MAG: PSD1 and planctomycete cytochrome C domain-containing protein [Maioricimonas sp. JB045]
MPRPATPCPALRIGTATVVVLLGLLTVPLPAAAAPVDYESDIKPILKARCYACHGALKQEGSLRVDTARATIAGGDSGPAIVADDPAGSLLLERIAAEDEADRMPPEGKPLSAEQIDLFRRWIAAGAEAPADERPEEDPTRHWAFVAPVRPAVPAGADEGSRNPIDAFLDARLREQNLSPLPRADRRVQLRRLYLDLTGLPPTRQEQQLFLDDDSPDAWENLVDRLLASPRHGERWGRHWLDVWRYSDWYGRRSVPDVLNSYGQIWRWRDWIVRSLNEDAGYDRMVRAMLAADELYAGNDEEVVATGFIVRNFYRWNYNTWMKDSVEHTGKAFLGLTLNCCQCHDHKYDPIGQEEYFAFRAFFEPIEIRTDRVPGEPDPGPYPKYDYGVSYKPISSGLVRIVDETLDAETFMYLGGEARNIVPDKPPIPPAAPAVIGGDQLKIAPVDLPPEAWYPGMKAFVREEERTARQMTLTAARSELEAAQRETQDRLAPLEQELAAARAAWDAVRPADAPGLQALKLDASQGRRILANSLNELPVLPPESELSLKLTLIDDGKVNFQLSNDLAGGRTNLYVVFVDGEIRTYPPQSTRETAIGRYGFAEGQTEFAITVRLEPSADRGLLTITSTSDNAVLVDAVPIAMNGWDPAADPNRGMYLDAHPGSIARFDDIAFRDLTDNSELARFDFEPATCTAGEDVAGRDGWSISRYSVAPATSVVELARPLTEEEQQARNRLNAAERALSVPRTRLAAAEQAVIAAEADLAALEARIAADEARYRHESPDATELIQTAVELELKANLALALAAEATARRDLAAAQALPEGDENRAKQIDAAGKALTAAGQQLSAARTSLAAPPDDYTPLSPQYPRQSTGRRAALARWMTSRDNPLTARVAVNHIWLRHFGRGLVETPANFGRNGEPPSHPELLDWLAVELMENGWSMKHIHRLIVTSEAYRRRSSLGAATHPNQEIDRDNRAYWRFNPGRMEAEVVRDGILYLAGSLDETIGGHEIDHKEGLTAPRRSLYFAHHGESKMEFLELFDGANACDCYRRTTSVMPQQALALSNSQLAVAQGRLLAGRLGEELGEAGDAAAFVDAAFEQILTRPPTHAERAASLEFLAQQQGLFTDSESVPDPVLRARENLVQALFSHNEFVTIR